MVNVFNDKLVPTDFGSRDVWGLLNNTILIAADEWAVRSQATFHIQNPQNKTYMLEMNSRFPFTVKDATYKTNAGTATLAIEIGGSPVGALGSLSATSTEQTAAATTDKEVAIGDDVTLVVSSVSGVDDLFINVWFDRTDAGTA